jgi:ribosomal protein S18 acetylase RimI-like enzyme
MRVARMRSSWLQRMRLMIVRTLRRVDTRHVHRDHRGHGYGYGYGYGYAITVAAAAALQELGSSSAIVCTPSFNVGAVATYKPAGFQQLPEVRDRYRDA